MIISETYIQVRTDRKTGEEVRLGAGESGEYEAFTDNREKLYRSLVKEYGRCTGRVYIDLPGGKTQGIGWVFVKRLKFDDCNETYLSEVWVTLHTSKTLEFRR